MIDLDALERRARIYDARPGGYKLVGSVSVEPDDLLALVHAVRAAMEVPWAENVRFPTAALDELREALAPFRKDSP